jgi:hypothetical protein
VLCLACAGIAFFATVSGVPQTIWANDQSMMTSVIAVLFVGTVCYLGRQAWETDTPGRQLRSPGDSAQWIRIGDSRKPDSTFGHLAERLCVMAGFVGTAIGLSLQAKALAGGLASFGALSTSLFTTASGGTAAALIAIMTFNLEAGTRRAHQRLES